MRIQLFDYKDLNIVEFTIGEMNADCRLCTEKSKYVHGAVFSVFQPAFELSNKDFNYFEQTGFSNSILVSLRNHLQDYLSRVSSIENQDDLEIMILKQLEGIDFMNELKTFYPDWRIKWETIKNELVEVLKNILERVDFCIDEDKVFWVKGY